MHEYVQNSLVNNKYTKAEKTINAEALKKVNVIQKDTFFLRVLEIIIKQTEE